MNAIVRSRSARRGLLHASHRLSGLLLRQISKGVRRCVNYYYLTYEGSLFCLGDLLDFVYFYEITDLFANPVTGLFFPQVISFVLF